MTVDITLWDTAFAVILGVVFPIWGWFEAKRFRKALQAGAPDLLIKNYRQTMLTLWGLVFVLFLLWWGFDRSPLMLGLGFAGTWTNWTGLALAGLVSCLFYLQIRSVRSDAEAAASVRAQIENQPDIEAMMPKTRAEYRLFRGVSFTAGITEEVLYRGFLIWCLSVFMPVWAAAGLSLVAFVLAHLYQGSIEALARVAGIGLVLTLLYLLSGSLWPAIIVHIAVDLMAGAAFWYANQQSNKPSPAAS